MEADIHLPSQLRRFGEQLTGLLELRVAQVGDELLDFVRSFVATSSERREREHVERHGELCRRSFEVVVMSRRKDDRGHEARVGRRVDGLFRFLDCVVYCVNRGPRGRRQRRGVVVTMFPGACTTRIGTDVVVDELQDVNQLTDDAREHEAVSPVRARAFRTESDGVRDGEDVREHRSQDEA